MIVIVRAHNEIIVGTVFPVEIEHVTTIFIILGSVLVRWFNPCCFGFFQSLHRRCFFTTSGFSEKVTRFLFDDDTHILTALFVSSSLLHNHHHLVKQMDVTVDNVFVNFLG